MRTAHIIPFLKKVHGFPPNKKRQSNPLDSTVEDTSSASCPTNLLPPLEKEHAVPNKSMSLLFQQCSFLAYLCLLLNSCSPFKAQPTWQQAWQSPILAQTPALPGRFANTALGAVPPCPVTVLLFSTRW